ncbi:MAG: adenylate/guanylate cyclase domain-containing protein [Chloroflexota bacterium]|nr:MAG: adenylate/guanylate cyclase domain-containing protein [Chloroflexota bacterium]
MEQDLERHFQDLLLAYSQQIYPEGRKQVEDTLWKEYGAEHTVFVLDMSGFSLLCRKYGIIHYLSMVRRMQLTAAPVVKSCGGRVVKFEADNCFAVFPDPLSAVRSAIAMQFAFDAANLLTPDELDIRISCGIDCGRILMVGEHDCFGEAVNRACKLGEDIASASEILVTQDAMGLIPPEAGIKYSEVSLSISGITIPACTIDYRTN